MRKILVIIGSNRPVRNAKRVADWLKTITDNYQELSFTYIDLAEINLPFINEQSISSNGRMGSYEHGHTKEWSELVASHDGYIAVSPEYNHGPSAVLKNAFDTVYTEWHNKPIGFVGFGAQMGIRSVEILRLVAVALHMAPIRNQVYVDIFPRMNEDGSIRFDVELVKQANAMLGQLKWWTEALAVAREKDNE